MQNVEEIARLANLARARIKEISRDEADVLLEAGALLLDVRDAREYRSGHLSGAVQLSWDALDPGISELAPEKSTAIVCYCAIGHRSAIAADGLQQLGYTNVASIEGGLKAYLASTKTRRSA